MKKNILIMGAPRCGKTTLAKKLFKEKGYSIISIDDIVSGFEAYPTLNIKHDTSDSETSTRLAPFLIKYFTDLSEGSIFYDDIKYVIEGTHIDFELLMPILQSDKYKEKYKLIGLTYNDATEESIYNDIKKYDTEDEWTYWRSDEELKGDIGFFIRRNKFFSEKFKEYKIETYDVSNNRTEVLKSIVENLVNE